MTNKSRPSDFWLIVIFVVGAAFLRLLLTGMNFSPVAAIVLFGGFYFKDRRIAFSLPILIMLLTDAALELAFMLGWRDYPGFHHSMPYVYIGFILIALIGTRIKNIKPITLIGTGLISSITFFIITNFGVWITGGYSATFYGLLECYANAIPFYRSSEATQLFLFNLLGDQIFIGVFFGGYALLKSRVPQLARA